ncbi:MAG: molybdopterin molybdotransferase MoeA [Acidobacteriaceae bacterium]|nr:molybdopterin molybdotransferase MoeA [Acidobacteriaceae bacterium]
MPTPVERSALEFYEARRIVIDAVRSITIHRRVETVSVEAAYSRMLAQAVIADRDYPAVRRSLRDGFAIMSWDVPGTLKIRGETRAGQVLQTGLQKGEALEIMTGAPVPDEADGVVMLEHVTRVAGADGRPAVNIDQRAEPGQFINERGAEAKEGDVLIAPSTRIDASHIATLAMAGYTSVQVFAPPALAILATGDEIVDIDLEPASHQVRNSNSYMLASLVSACGGKPAILPVARDTKEALRPLLEKGLQYDMLLISGGVSAGRYDLVKPTLRELAADIHFERVRIQPGGPTAFATLANKPVFGLPGNPGSSYVTFRLFAQPALEILGGQTEPLLAFLSARFEAPFRHKSGLTRFLPARLSADGEYLRHIRWQGSSDVPALGKANAFLVADHDRESWERGDLIRVMQKL